MTKSAQIIVLLCQVQSGASGCEKGFVKCFLKVPLSYLGSTAAAVQPNGLWNFQKHVLQNLFHNQAPQTVQSGYGGCHTGYGKTDRMGSTGQCGPLFHLLCDIHHSYTVSDTCFFRPKEERQGSNIPGTPEHLPQPEAVAEAGAHGEVQRVEDGAVVDGVRAS